MLRFLACMSILFALEVVCGGSPRAEEKKSCLLSFALGEGTVLHYKSFNQTEQNYGGMDVSMNQTYEVDMSSAGKKDSTGTTPVDLKYLAIKSSLVMAGKLQEWEPPIKLQGAIIRAFVSSAGEVVRFDPGHNIPGLHSKDDLADVVDAWFIKLPDTTVAVGQTWTEKIVKGKKEGAEPEVTGEAVYTLKKIEMRGNLEIAVIEGKATLKLNRETPAGTLVAEGKVDAKAQIAVPGGYIVELKQNFDIRGNTVAKDPLTDKETKRQTAVTQYTEIKLQQ
jgi:hypothetical protein